MKLFDRLISYGLPPSEEVLGEVRQILAKEVQLESSGHGDQREDDLAFLCCALLFSKGHLEDSLLVWEAKTCGFDLDLYLDVQLLCGAGLERTKQFLSDHPSENVKAALGYIRQCESCGDFDGWSPSEQIEDYRRYFGIA